MESGSYKVNVTVHSNIIVVCQEVWGKVCLELVGVVIGCDSSDDSWDNEWSELGKIICIFLQCNDTGSPEDLFDFVVVVSIVDAGEHWCESRHKGLVFLFGIVILLALGEMNKDEDINVVYLLTPGALPSLRCIICVPEMERFAVSASSSACQGIDIMGMEGLKGG